ncbi:MAG: PfkB family carbohydrate kinase [Thiohalophilus sp.]|uniref:PfkB family carbohydrate kinase n=1 Tax=Thiohalophilus sp. TaxID=3028392 RepID=UPI0028707DE1|nr:PfkB family carbohydrate kinase [Thiohalophilus sp.]MDR9436201.1 PfkB family carbohydrate kinase [Thiohalophilus sp.]
MSRILCTGIATLDIINQVDHYPAEDEEMRATAQFVRRGGNAANTACVMSQFDHQIELLTTLGEDAAGQTICQDLQQYGVNTRHMVTLPQGRTPTSCITLNQRNGSRTIVHYRDLPELRPGDFPLQEVERYDWFHFEGRNIETLENILVQLKEHRIDQPVSIEIEKPRPGIERLYPYADILLFSRAFAKACDYTCADGLFDDLRRRDVNAILIGAWGDEGAFACDATGQRYHAPASAPARVIDTLGAGDTFNAGVILALLEGRPLDSALNAACELAGRKVGQNGFANLNLPEGE